MENSKMISVSVSDGFEPEPVSLPSSGDLSVDRSHSDLDHAAEDLSEEFKNVGLDEFAKEQSLTIMSVSESNGGVDSKAADGNEEEGRYDADGDDNGGSESEGENMFEKREALYPLRPGAEDCSFYMKTGSCKFGSTCKFNHPLPNPRRIQIAWDNKVREKEEDVDKLRLMDCKYYFRTGGCKYGGTCRFNHTKQKNFQSSVPELNFIGLPIRQGAIECPYYMRNGSCKFGADCKFNHPDPTTVGGTVDHFHGNNGGSFSPKSTFQASSNSWSGTTPFVPSMLSQSRGVTSQTPEWNGYQASAYSSERNVFSPSTTYLMNNSSAAATSVFSQYQPAEEFPERPDQPECTYYLKTGDCKFKFNCKFHHPKNRLPKQPPYALSDKGLPLRPDQNICTHYSRYGICKFGPACRFDHSVQPTGSALAVGEPPHVGGGNGDESDGWN
uniref:Zinc finger CCCH domain-containing protein 43 n=1 Tax=Noccaea caerulescens TaxID=107243 RepID=A0A1J3F060_NOCCA